ncbi:MAG: PHP domain-containing protein [Tidjanibacter sp.]|nr:PHP domain-containing protein [Tidjanibacter sp.]
MNRYKVDLHIHTLLSPCGDLFMSPRTIVATALAKGLDAIAITDHNSTLQVETVQKIGRREGLTVFCGVELTTREEAHCVALLPDLSAAAWLQKWVDQKIVKVPNDPERLGDEVWVDEQENIVGEVEWYLNSPIDASTEEIADRVTDCGGLFVPAHIDRASYSLIGQLGFISPALPVAAVEYNFAEKYQQLCAAQKYLARYTAYTASDAHFPHLIGANPSWLTAEHRTFNELRKAFAAEDGRRIESCGEQ